MQVELAQLLRDRTIGHPSRVVSATLEGGDFRLSVTGWPWWTDQADRKRDHTIEFLFQGLGDGVINLAAFGPEEDEVLEAFSVVESNSVPWAKAGGSDIYCNGPLSTPFDVYFAVHDFLITHGSFLCPWDFLNCPDGERLLSFLELAKGGSYLLGRFPTVVRDIVCAELDAQSVPYSELHWTHSMADGRLLVNIGKSQFFCENASAIFET